MLITINRVIKVINDRCCCPVETSQLIRSANQITAFHMMGQLVIKGLKISKGTLWRSGNIYFFKINKSSRTMCEICLKLTIETPELRHWHCSGVFYWLWLTIFWCFQHWLWTSKYQLRMAYKYFNVIDTKQHKTKRE